MGKVAFTVQAFALSVGLVGCVGVASTNEIDEGNEIGEDGRADGSRSIASILLADGFECVQGTPVAGPFTTAELACVSRAVDAAAQSIEELSRSRDVPFDSPNRMAEGELHALVSKARDGHHNLCNAERGADTAADTTCLIALEFGFVNAFVDAIAFRGDPEAPSGVPLFSGFAPFLYLNLDGELITEPDPADGRVGSEDQGFTRLLDLAGWQDTTIPGLSDFMFEHAWNLFNVSTALEKVTSPVYEMQHAVPMAHRLVGAIERTRAHFEPLWIQR